MVGVMYLISGSFGGGGIGNLLSQWEAAGVFSYALPFLLIFAMVFAVLSFVPIFKDNKGINAIISLVTALMALQFNLVSVFFAEIFPRLGVGLSIVLVIVILLGLFVGDEDVAGNKYIKWIIVIVVMVIIAVIVSNSMSSLGFTAGGGAFWNYLRYNGANVAVYVLIAVAIIAVIAMQNPKSKREVPPINLGGFFPKH